MVPKRFCRTAAALLLVVSCLFAPAISRAQEATDSLRKVVTRVPPQYPSLARNMQIKGSVKVEAVVSPNGTVKSVEVRGGHPVLAQSALNAVRQWKWEPAPRETHEVIEIKFTP
jgi:TonB family protein